MGIIQHTVVPLQHLGFFYVNFVLETLANTMLLLMIWAFTTVSYWQKRACGVTQLISSAAKAKGLLHRNSCTRNCLAHQCANCTPASRAWILSPLISQLQAHLISLPITSSLKLESLEEASVSNLKGGFPDLLRVSCLLKRKKNLQSQALPIALLKFLLGNDPSDRVCSQWRISRATLKPTASRGSHPTMLIK